MDTYGKMPWRCGTFHLDLREVMYYLYLPVRIPSNSILRPLRLPQNVECTRQMILFAERFAKNELELEFDYTYLSARKGWASPDNPLNRPGWHCDGFGSADLNFVWWSGPGTRFAIQDFHNISESHVESLRQFEEQVDLESLVTYPEHTLLGLDSKVVHATPLIAAPGCMRQFVKISLSNERYNLENNSHNYLFDYDWELHSREVVRNDPAKAQADSI